MNEAMEYLKSCGTFYLATEENGQYAVLRGNCTLLPTIRKKYISR